MRKRDHLETGASPVPPSEARRNRYNAAILISSAKPLWIVGLRAKLAAE
jgi:hypothetical protein